MSSTTAPLLRVADLAVGFATGNGTLRAVDGVSVSLDRGQTLCVVGESGCGKSALAMSLPGLLPGNGRVLGGSIRLKDRELVGASAATLRSVRGAQIGVVFQDPLTALDPYLTIGAQLAEPLVLHKGLRGAACRARAAELLGQMGLSDTTAMLDRYPHQLSGGQRQRVLIALALAADPELLIADEPTTALDVTIQAQILALLRRERDARGLALLLITHDLGVVAGMADRCAVLYAGRVVEEAPVDALFARPSHPYTQALLGCLPRLDQPTAKLTPIPGQPPRLYGQRSACAFAPRCAKATAACHATDQTLQGLPSSAEHRVACAPAVAAAQAAEGVPR